MPRHTSSVRAALWIGIPLALAMGCGAAEKEGDVNPSAARIVRAVLTSLLSNSVEATPSENASRPDRAPDPDGSRPPPEPPPAAPGDGSLAGMAAGAPETCTVPYNGPVTIIRSPTPSAFARAVGARSRARLVYETEDTAIWEDGHVITTDVENLGNHLNAVGWASNPMQIAGASARPGASGANLGWDSATSSFQKKDQKRKKRRRRG